MTAPRIKGLLALAMILGSGVYIYLVFNPVPPAPNLIAHRLLGQRTGEEAVKLLAGGKLILIAPDTKTFPNRCAEAQLNAFHAALKRANVTVAASSNVKIDPNRAVRLDPGTFASLLRKYSEKDLIVSFMGPPIIAQDQRRLLPQRTARVLAVCTGDIARHIPLQPIFEQGLLHQAIISQLDASKDTVQVVTAGDSGRTGSL